MPDAVPTPPDLESAVRPDGAGVLVDVEVVPGASASAFPAGWNPWRRRIGVRVAAPPQDGRANAELTRVVAAFFGVPDRDVAVAAGATSRQKTLEVRGLDADAARRALEKGLAAASPGDPR